MQRPAYGAAGVPVTLTARVQKGGFWREVEQPVTVAPYNDEWKAVHSVSEALVLEGIDNLTQSLTLPTSLVDDETGKTVSITWVTNNDAVISSTGQISRPGIGEPAKSAELTATFVASVRNRYEERVVKTYAVTLAPLGEEESQAKNAAKAEAEEALAAKMCIRDRPSKGTSMLVNATTLQWKIDELGVTANEGASLEFFIKHVGQDSGTKLVNESITYSDSENNVVTFPAPTVTVDCGVVVHPEPCPVPVDLALNHCQDSVVDVYKRQA